MVAADRTCAATGRRAICSYDLVSALARASNTRVFRVDRNRAGSRGTWWSSRARGVAGTIAIAALSLHCQGAAAPPATPVAKEAVNAKPVPVGIEEAPTTTTPAVEAPAPTSDAGTTPSVTPERPPLVELPRGGRELFPTYRLAGFCGTPGAPALGRLAGDLKAKTKTMLSYADKYPHGRKVLPVFELIAVVVQGAPGNDGKWRRRVPDSVVDQYLQAARAAKGILLLNIQPGHSDFLTETKHFEKYLRQPDVGVALDPEWAMKGKQKPGAIFGQTTGAVINDVAEYMAGLVKAGDLPEKALVFHQVNDHVLKDESVIVGHPGVAIIKSVDGLGPKGSKIKTYNYLVKSMPASVHAGFKLFFDEDKTNGGKLMTPEEVLALTPEPEYVMYE
jgi:hypothetical protein